MTPRKPRRSWKVEKNMPMPPRLNGHRPRLYPLDRMEVGDSFAFEEWLRQRISASTSSYDKKTGAVFTIRRVSDEYCRCWRLK